MRLYDWYMEKYPDSIGVSDLTNIEFSTLYDGLINGINVYDLIGHGSVSFEAEDRIIGKLKELYNLTDEDVSRIWSAGSLCGRS